MRIGVLGSGPVGETLAAGALKKGREVCIGSGHPEKLAGFQLSHPNMRTGTFADAATFGDILFLAVKGLAAKSVIGGIPESLLSGKTVIDATNPISDDPPEDGVLKFFTTLDRSLMEELQAEFPYAHFVKAFNSVGAAKMVDPIYTAGRPTMFICGNDIHAKGHTKRLLDEFGWETADMGSAVAARAIEPLCMLWCIPGFRENHWGHAFKLLNV